MFPLLYLTPELRSEYRLHCRGWAEHCGWCSARPCLCVISAPPPARVRPRPLGGGVPAAGRAGTSPMGPSLTSGPSCEWLSAARRRTDREQRCSLQEAARITLGVLGGGGMTPTGVKEEEGSVWRRKEEKKPSKPDKASEKRSEELSAEQETQTRKTLSPAGGRSLMDSMSSRIGQTLLRLAPAPL